MSTDALSLLVEPATDGVVRLGAPKLGVWSQAPAAGTPVGPGSPAGVLSVLRKRYRLVVPEGVFGTIAAGASRDRASPVAYGELVLTILPLAGAVVAAAGAPAEEAVAGGRRVLAPTDGVYYGAPAPGAAPYVARGDRVRIGQTIGLIEVMKTFNPIPYGGPGLPDEAEVVEILVADGVEVRAGQALVAVR